MRPSQETRCGLGSTLIRRFVAGRLAAEPPATLRRIVGTPRDISTKDVVSAFVQ